MKLSSFQEIQEPKNYIYRVRSITPIDGDTVKAMIDFGCKIFKELTMRLWGIDSPQIKTKEGQDAAMHLEFALMSKIDSKTKLLSDILVQTLLDKNDKYGRMLCIIYKRGEDGVFRSINYDMVQRSLAVEYYGGKR